MSRRWTAVVVVLTVIVLAVVGWLWLSGRVAEETGQPPNTEKTAPTVENAATPTSSSLAVSPPLPESLSRKEKPTTSTAESLAALFKGMAPSRPIQAALEGTVYSGTKENAAPLAGVTVRVSNIRYPGIAKPFAETSTDDDGHYRFVRLPVESVILQFSTPGYTREWEMIDLSGSSKESQGPAPLRERRPFHLDVYLTPGGGTIAGRVVSKESGEAIVGARVIDQNLFTSAHVETFTDMDGRFRIEGLPAKTGNVIASADGFAATFLQNVLPGGNPVTIALQPGGARITGLVRDGETGKPTAGATVSVMTANARCALSVPTGENGRFETAPLPAGYYLVSAYSGYRELNAPVSHTIQIPEGSREDVWVELELTGTMAIRGVVRDKETKAAVSGALVCLMNYGSSGGREVGGGPAALTDGRGRFFIPQAAEGTGGRMGVLVEADGYLKGFANAHRPKAGGNPAPVVILLEKGVRFHGRVRDAAGAPAPGVKLRGDIGGPLWSQTVNLETGRNGEFSAQYPDRVLGGKVRLTVWSSEGYCSDSFEWPRDARDVERNFTLKTGCEVDVKVLDENKAGVPGLKATLAVPQTVERYYQEVDTDENGVAVFRNVPGGKATVYVLRGEERVAHCDETPDLATVKSPYLLVLSTETGRWTCSGRVVDSQGSPLSDVSVSYMGPHETRAVHTDEKGRFHFELGDFTPSLYFEKEGYEQACKAPRREKGKKEVYLEITLRRNARFFGRLIDEQGKPVGGTVTLSGDAKALDPTTGEPTGPAQRFEQPSEVAVGADGSFSFAPGYFDPATKAAYSIIINHPSLGVGSSNWIAANGRSELGPFEVRLGWRTLKGRVVDAETGEGVADATVTVCPYNVERDALDPKRWLGNCDRAKTQTDAAGAYELAPLTQAGDTVSVYQPVYGVQSFPAPRFTDGSNEETLDLKLQPRVDWRGRLLDAEGRPVENWTVTVLEKRKNGQTGAGRFACWRRPTLNARTFHLQGLRPGRVQVVAGILSPQEYEPAVLYTWEMDLPAKREFNQDLHLPSGFPVTITVPPGRPQISLALEPAQKGGVGLSLSTPLTRGATKETVWTVTIPPGQYRVTGIGLGTGAAAGAPGSPKELNVTVTPGGQNRIQIP